MTDASIDPRLAAYRAAWARKPALRAVYADYYARIERAAGAGRMLEIGGGVGQLRDRFADIVVTDIQSAPWLDVTADAQALPFAAASIDGIVLVDVLHHIEAPRLFFAEAVRVLRPGGRIVMLEPAITPIAGLFYRVAHDEPVDMNADPLAESARDPARDPYDSNQAVATLLFGRGRAGLEHAFPQLRVRRASHLSLLAYPLCGGFRPWSLIPAWLVRPTLLLEAALLPLLGPLLGFRLFVVIERR